MISLLFPFSHNINYSSYIQGSRIVSSWTLKHPNEFLKDNRIKAFNRIKAKACDSQPSGNLKNTL